MDIGRQREQIPQIVNTICSKEFCGDTLKSKISKDGHSVGSIFRLENDVGDGGQQRARDVSAARALFSTVTFSPPP